jgi:hypothetical protein
MNDCEFIVRQEQGEFTARGKEVAVPEEEAGNGQLGNGVVVLANPEDVSRGNSERTALAKVSPQ